MMDIPIIMITCLCELALFIGKQTQSIMQPKFRQKHMKVMNFYILCTRSEGRTTWRSYSGISEGDHILRSVTW